MVGIQIDNGFIDLAKTDFECPHCKKQYSDADDKYVEKCNKTKSGIISIKCDCDKKFYMTYSYMGDAVSFIK